jgi:DNA repair protein RadA/Sms
MPRTSTRFVCQKCGYESIKWLGKCPDCGSWNSLTEELQVARPAAPVARVFGAEVSPPRAITEIAIEDHQRVPSGIGEFDRVLGGGIVPGSLVLIGGDPGIGKCVTAETRVIDPCSGAYLPITEWRSRDRRVLAVDETTLRTTPAAVTAFHERGVQPVVRIETALGRTLRCTPDHPVLTPEGWRPVGGLTAGCRIAAPRSLPYFGRDPMEPAAVRLIAYVLSDGSAQSQISVTNHLPEVARDLEEIAAAFDVRLVCYEKRGNRARQYRFSNPWHHRAPARREVAAALWSIKERTGTSWQGWARRAGVSYTAMNSWRRAVCVPSVGECQRLADALDIPATDLVPNARNRAAAKTSVEHFLETVGLRSLTARTKAVPACIFRLPREQLALFLRTLFTCDGSVYVNKRGQPGVVYSTISHRLAQDVHHLLLRYGLVSTVRSKQLRVKDCPYAAHEVVLLGVHNVQRFLDTIGIIGREVACSRIAKMESGGGPSTQRDTIPTGASFWEHIRTATGNTSFAEISRRAGVKIKNRRHQRPLCRATVAAVADVFPDARLQALAYGDVYWDEIGSIQSDGEAPVYDLTVPGNANFVANDLIVHNSTLLSQVASQVSAKHGRTLYVTGEESVQQVKMRAERLAALSPELLLAAETEIDVIEAHIASLKPRFVVIDSIQTMHDSSIASASATVSQVRACTARLMRLAKTTHTTVFIVGHVTKEGTIAGPRVLEHIVDTVLYFEGDRFQAHRILRAVKNRFGSTDELGIFEMGEAGLTEVANASEMLLQERPSHGPGSAVVAVIEGTRPLLVEIQALVAHSFYTSPRRMTSGVDNNRTAMILAVLEKRAGLRMADKDVYVNVAGGLKLVEPAVDLGIALALASSYRDQPVDPSLVVAGEVGLAGEVRAVQQTDKRLKEAERLGFERAITARPPGRRPALKTTMKLEPVGTLREALGLALVPDLAGAPFGEEEAAMEEPFGSSE